MIRALRARRLVRHRDVAIQELEALRRAGAPVPPGVRQDYGYWRQTGRLPVRPPRPARFPKRLRLTDPGSPIGYREIRPTAGQSAVIDVGGEKHLVTPATIYKGYLQARRELPAAARAIAANRAILRNVDRRIDKLRSLIRNGDPRWAVYRKKIRALSQRLAEKGVTHSELEEALSESTRILDERERQASDAGVGFVFAWPLAVLVSSLALSAWGVYREYEDTKRLEAETSAVERGLLSPEQVAANRSGIAGVLGSLTGSLKGVTGLLLAGGGIWLAANLVRGGRRA